VIKVAGSKDRYYRWDKLASAVSKTGTVTGTSGLQVQETKTEVVAKKVTWKEGGRNGTTYSAPGAGITVSATVKAPLAGDDGNVMKLEWWADALERDPEYRNGFTFESLNYGYWRNGRLLLAEYMIADSDAYWRHCWRKAFFAGLPFALSFFTVACIFLLGRPQEPAADPGAAPWPMVFAPKYNAVKLWFGVWWFVFSTPFIVVSVISLVSNQGDNMEEHPLSGLLAVAAYSVALFSAWWVRMNFVKRVEVRPEGILIDCGDGWGRTIDLPWSAMTKVEPMHVTKGGKVISRYLRIHRSAGAPVIIREDSTRDYERLRDLIVDFFGHFHRPG